LAIAARFYTLHDYFTAISLSLHNIPVRLNQRVKKNKKVSCNNNNNKKNNTAIAKFVGGIRMTTYVELVELYRQEKTEVGLLRGKSVHSPLCPPLTNCTWTDLGCIPDLSSEKSATTSLSHAMTPHPAL